MGEKKLLASGAHDIYLENGKAVKLFAKGFPKAEVLREAMHQSLAQERGIKVPSVEGVTAGADGRWAIISEYIEGETLAALMEAHPERRQEYLEQMTKLQIEIFRKNSPVLGSLKEKMAHQIQSVEELGEVNRFEILTKLNGMKNHRKLCHGDFCPDNIIVGKDGWYVLDWIHAAAGNASGDAARTYLLLSLTNKEDADYYLETFCRLTGIERSYVNEWIPIVAAAQLVKKRRHEREPLLKCVDVCDTD